MKCISLQCNELAELVHEDLATDGPEFRATVRVLLIEDDETDAIFLARTLAKQHECDFEIEHASSLNSAIQCLRTTEYDVALLDVHLPDSQGAESFEQIRAFDSRLPIVVLTGSDDTNLALHAIECGAQDYVSKGDFSAISMMRTLRFAIMRHQMMLGYQAAADTDALTGLPNRRNLDQRFSEALSESAIDVGMWVAVLDIDHFKLINDRYGHAAGDDVLRMIAQKFVQLVDDSVWVGRLGGEEFVVLMPGRTDVQAIELAKNLNREIAETAFRLSDKDVRATISIGIANARNGEQWDDVFVRCDNALYDAKLQGRNCLIVYQSSESDEFACA